MRSLNEELFLWIFNLAHQNIWLDRLLIFTAQYLPYILFLSALVLIFSEPGWKRRIFFASHLVLVIVVARGIIVEALNYFYPTLRPFEVLEIQPLFKVVGSSFPSSHATIFFGLTAVIFYLNRKWGWWYFLLVTINALARVAVGVHWPLDIAVGALIGVLSAVMVYQLLEVYFKKISLPQAVKGWEVEK